MSGAARIARPFTLMVDSLAPARREAAVALFAAGYRVWGRYLENLTPGERDMLFELGFAIVPIIEGRAPEHVTPEGGTETGAVSVRRATVLGVPPRVDVTIDSEATGQQSKANVIAYDDNCAATLVHSGFGAMLYVGSGQPLDGHELFLRRPDRYFRGAGRIPEVDCGWCALQAEPLDQPLTALVPGYPPSAPGATDKFDVSLIQGDFKGRLPVVWAPEAAA